MAEIHIGTISSDEIRRMQRNLTPEELEDYLRERNRGIGPHKNKRDKRTANKLRKEMETESE